MAASLDLPTEVFTQIFLLISRHQLTACALVSRLWYAQTTPFLYQNIDLTWSRSFKICNQHVDNIHLDHCPCEELGKCWPEEHDCDLPLHWWDRRHVSRARCLENIPYATEKWPSLFTLVNTLVRSPSLARLVRDIRLAGPVPRSIWTSPQQTGLSKDERRQIESILPCDSDMSKAGWLRRLDNGCPHAFVAVLLMCVSDLRSLDLGLHFQDALQIIGCRALVRTLGHLDTVAVGSTRETVWLGTSRGPLTQANDYPQLLLLRLASVRSLTVNLARLRNPHLWPNVTFGALTTALETLELAFTFLDERDLARLLQVCPRLRTLKYDYWTTPALIDPHGRDDDEYIPDLLSERLVETRVLESSLSIVWGSLLTLHIHIISPRQSFSQNLRSIDLSRFEFLTELHVPLQLLVNKNSPRTLADSLPLSLRHLWLNDDATLLWLNHGFFMSSREFVLEDRADPTDDPSWNPIYTDLEIVDLIADFLSDWRAHVPGLRDLKLLFYHIQCPYWDPRDITYLQNTLEPAGSQAGIDTMVIQVHERPCCQWDRLVVAGQDPPYFTLGTLKESSWPHTRS